MRAAILPPLDGLTRFQTMEFITRAKAPAVSSVLPIMEPMEDRVLFATILVTNTNNSGGGSLRDAMLRANKSSDADVIQFKIGTGRRSIAPLTALPQLKYVTSLDGSTQGGYAGKPLIEIRGDRMGSTTAGLVLHGGSGTIRGLAVNRFSGNGILLMGKGGNTIRGCYIGTDATGAYAAGNKQKGLIVQSAYNRIGGTSSWDRNVISGNIGAGVQFYTSAATGNKLLGNYIGTDATGTKAVGNGTSGVAVRSAARTVIGGTVSGSRNVISGNKQDGIVVNGSGARYTLIQGNYVGTNAAGTARLGNGWYGIETSESYTTIGGTTASARNVISGNKYSGVVLWLSSGSYNKVQGNYIGTDYTGRYDLGNYWRGVDISSGSKNNLIGGASSAERNIISGNEHDGVRIYQGSYNKVQGNYIGLAANGYTALRNTGDGVRLVQTSTATIQSNRIGYNGGYAVFNGSSSGTKVFSNTLISDTLFNVKQT
jgi:hypothetical protein